MVVGKDDGDVSAPRGRPAGRLVKECGELSGEGDSAGH